MNSKPHFFSALISVTALTLSSLWTIHAVAAVPSEKPKPSVSKILSGQGISYGGLAGTGFTLLDLRRTATKDQKIERLVIDVGDLGGQTIRGWPGYYHAELKSNPSRLIIDFAQMPNANLDSDQLAARLKSSAAVTKTSMTVDPVDSSLNLTLDLKKNTKVRVYQVSGKKTTSKVVVDLISE